MRNARLWDCLDQWQIGMFPTDPRAHIEIAQSLNTVRRGENWELWVTIMSNENVKTILLKRFCIECLGLPFPKLFLLCVLLPLDWNHTHGACLIIRLISLLQTSNTRNPNFLDERFVEILTGFLFHVIWMYTPEMSLTCHQNWFLKSQKLRLACDYNIIKRVGRKEMNSLFDTNNASHLS